MWCLGKALEETLSSRTDHTRILLESEETYITHPAIPSPPFNFDSKELGKADVVYTFPKNPVRRYGILLASLSNQS